MRVAVIGNGNVGMAVFRELQKLWEINELVLVGRNIEKIKAEILDFRDAEILSPSSKKSKLSSGGYEETKDADIIIYTAGVGRKPGQSRLELVQQNAEIARGIFREVIKYNQNAIILVISNPVDVLTAVIREETGFPRNRVIGTGTLLDTARLIAYITSLLDISPKAVSALMLGEHGNSSCVIWSAVRILGMPLSDYFDIDIESDISIQEDKLSEFVRAVGGKIIEAKGYTAYGVAAAAAKITTAIIEDTHDILPVSILLDGEYGQKGIAISVPCMIGREGVIRVVNMKFTEEEEAAFRHSADVLREVTEPVLGIAKKE